MSSLDNKVCMTSKSLENLTNSILKFENLIKLKLTWNMYFLLNNKNKKNYFENSNIIGNQTKIIIKQKFNFLSKLFY